MDLTQITDSLSLLGNKLADANVWVITQLSQLGATISPMSAKIINLLILSVIAYLLVKLIHLTNRPLKFFIVFLIFLLIASTIFSFIQ